MTTATEKRIQELNRLILKNLLQPNTVENAAQWKRLQDERSLLKNSINQ